MIRAWTVLLVCQLVGEIITRGLSLPLPGPVLGMVLLWVILLGRGSTPGWLAETANGLVQHLSLLFVPAGVGIMTHVALLQEEWLALLITILGSTLITLVVTAWTMRLLFRRMQ